MSDNPTPSQPRPRPLAELVELARITTNRLDHLLSFQAKYDEFAPGQYMERRLLAVALDGLREAVAQEEASPESAQSAWSSQRAHWTELIEDLHGHRCPGRVCSCLSNASQR